MPDTEEMQRGGGQTLLSRRQILTGTSVGIGATLLFHHTARNRVDVPATPRPTPPAVPDAPEQAAGMSASPATVPASDVRDDEPRVVDDDGGLVERDDSAVHRSQLSDHGQPRAVAKGGQGVLVMGMSDAGEPLGWLTDDGSQWVEHTLGSDDHQRAEVWGVAAFGTDYIAVGATEQREVRRILESGAADVDAHVTFLKRRRSPTVWRTSDCVRWSGTSFTDVGGPHSELVSVACDGFRLVAVGRRLDPDGAMGARGLILTSTDGDSWRQVDLGDDAVMTEGSFTGVAVADGVWYATSVDISGGAVWSSTDGTSWTVVPGSREAFVRIALQGIGVVDGRVLVAGSRVFDPQPRFWVSSKNGRGWRKAELDVSLLSGPEARVTDLAVISGDVVVVGTRKGTPVLEGGTLYVGD